MLHVLEEHDEGLPVGADPVEFDDVLVLQDGQQLGLPLEVQPGALRGFFQGLRREGERGCSGRRVRVPNRNDCRTHPGEALPQTQRGQEGRGPHLDGHQHLLLGGAEVVALGQEDLPESPLAQLPLQHNLPALDVPDGWGEEGSQASMEEVRGGARRPHGSHGPR